MSTVHGTDEWTAQESDALAATEYEESITGRPYELQGAQRGLLGDLVHDKLGLASAIFLVVLERLVSIAGAPPDLVRPPRGCPFRARCERATDQCVEEMPPLVAKEGGRHVACWHALDTVAV